MSPENKRQERKLFTKMGQAERRLEKCEIDIIESCKIMKYLTPLPGKAVEPPPLDQEALGTSSGMAGHPAAE